MYSNLHFAITLLGIFSIFEILKSGQKLSVLKYHIFARLLMIAAGSYFDYLELAGNDDFAYAGLAPIKTANPTQMAGDAKNYQVTIKHTFVDGLFNLFTSGFYTPTTTIVKK
jgi:hypothetical protein